jgi:transcriptional regulator with XRE-family HTH domain
MIGPSATRRGDNMLIGERLKGIRESKDLSQGDVEARTGLLRCYISRVENGHTVPAIETLEKMARALEIPMYQIFYDGENAKPLKVATNSNSDKPSTKQTRLAERVNDLVGRMRPRDRELLLIMARKLAQTR